MSSAKPIICRAAVLYDYGQPLVVEKVQIDAPTGNQVRVKLVSSAICISEAVLFEKKVTAEDAGNKLPLVLGHEGAGIVESVGPDVTTLKPGDHVLTTFLPRCGNCPVCSNPNVNFCAVDNFFTLGPVEHKTLLSTGKGIQSFAALGTFSEYILVKWNQLEKIDSTVPNLQSLSTLTCGSGIGFFARVDIVPGSTVAIWGLAGFGINAAFGAKVRGAKNIIVIDPIDNQKYEDLAREFGVTELINLNNLDKPVEQYLLEKYGGVDYAFDCNGNPESQIQGVKSLNLGGAFTFVAFTHTGATISYPVVQLGPGKSIANSVYDKVPTNEAYRQLINMYEIGKYPLDKLITHKFPLDQVNEALRSVIERKSIRTIITF